MGLMLGFAHLGHMQGVVGNIGADLRVHIEIAQNVPWLGRSASAFGALHF